MTIAIDVARRCGIAYYLTPENTCEMHGTDRQIEAFAEAIRAAEREACAKICEEIADNAWSRGEAKFGDIFAKAIRARDGDERGVSTNARNGGRIGSYRRNQND
jgi:hypothetical protein